MVWSRNFQTPDNRKIRGVNKRTNELIKQVSNDRPYPAQTISHFRSQQDRSRGVSRHLCESKSVIMLVNAPITNRARAEHGSNPNNSENNTYIPILCNNYPAVSTVLMMTLLIESAHLLIFFLTFKPFALNSCDVKYIGVMKGVHYVHEFFLEKEFIFRAVFSWVSLGVTFEFHFLGFVIGYQAHASFSANQHI